MEKYSNEGTSDDCLSSKDEGVDSLLVSRNRNFCIPLRGTIVITFLNDCCCCDGGGGWFFDDSFLAIKP